MNAPGDGVKLLLTLLFAAWVGAFGYSFFAYVTTAPDDMGFTRGLNRVKSFLGWQGMAGVLALAVFAVSLQWPESAGVRKVARVPLILTGVLVAGIAGVILWAGQA